ncbi:MAG: SDR family oxidoreductase [Alphaproteobacteria bacterium]|nr:SDR family oxidoreductase [Alphaproteobacteria bacterium]MDE2340562.1 SDR family oxidoreductase [Alphaproteobacteria bacterium]
MTDFAGRHIVITGASTGIGRASADVLVARGARVTLIARRAELLKAAVDELGAKAAFVVADVANRAQISAAFSTAEQRHGPIDGLFANAGFGGEFAPFGSFSDANWDALIATNLTSVFASIRAVLPAMIMRKAGSIVVTGSLASERGMPMNAGYVASKHGVLGLARAAAAEAAPHNVRVNCLIPGFIDTPMLGVLPDGAHEAMASATPQKRIGSSHECAALVAFLLSDAASHITAQSIAVDGGILGTYIPR